MIHPKWLDLTELGICVHIINLPLTGYSKTIYGLEQVQATNIRQKHVQVVQSFQDLVVRCVIIIMMNGLW
jgi:hypothetical protein